MRAAYTVGGFARIVGLSVKTLRFYEVLEGRPTCAVRLRASKPSPPAILDPTPTPRAERRRG